MGVTLPQGGGQGHAADHRAMKTCAQHVHGAMHSCWSMKSWPASQGASARVRDQCIATPQGWPGWDGQGRVQGAAGHLAVCALGAALHEDVHALGRAGAPLARGEAEAPAVGVARARQRQQRRVRACQRIAAGGMPVRPVLQLRAACQEASTPSSVHPETQVDTGMDVRAKGLDVLSGQMACCSILIDPWGRADLGPCI